MAIVPDKQLLTPGEVATLFRVDSKTVQRWARAGKLKEVRTIGGHRRFSRQQIVDLLNLYGNYSDDEF